MSDDRAKTFGSSERSWAATVTFSFVCFVGLLQLMTNGAPPTDYTLITWKWDYSLGVIKRGFLGWIVHSLVRDVTPTFVLRISIAIFVVCILVYALYAAVVAYRRPYLGTLIIAIMGVTLAPALPSYASTLGRLDQFNFIVLLVCCLLIFMGTGFTAATIISLLCCVCVLVHEGFIIVHLPLVCSLFLAGALTRHRRLAVGQLGILTAAPVLTFALLAIFSAPQMDLQNWATYWGGKEPLVPPSSPLLAAVNKIQFMGPSENFQWVVSYAAAHRFTFLYSVFVAISLVPASLILFRGATKHLPRPGVWWLVLISCYSPLAMFLLGIDFIRWSSYIVINIIVLVLALIFLESPELFGRVVLRSKDARYFVAATVAVFLCFPMTTGEWWPDFGKYSGCIYAATVDRRSITQRCRDVERNATIFE